MPRTQEYERLLLDLAGGELEPIEEEVFHALYMAWVYKKGPLSREKLCEMYFGYIPESLASSTEDRKIRKAIESLRNRGIPILSSSGESGYWLDVSEKAIKAMIAEWESRRARLGERVEAANRALIAIHRLGAQAIPATVQPHEKARQIGLF